MLVAVDTLLVASHLDTVPVDGMTIAPFDPHVRGGRMYGRGTCDTKAGMAAFDRSLLDDRGLMVTGPPGSRPDVGFPPLCCALDWNAYDPPKVGAVAAYNIIYRHALQQAAYLEERVGDPAAAPALRAEAAALR